MEEKTREKKEVSKIGEEQGKAGRKKEREKAVLVFLFQGEGEEEKKARMRELERIADSAGADTVHCFIQNSHRIDPRTLIGRGKAEEISCYVQENPVDCLIFEEELTGSQMRNLSDLIPVRILDRVDLILDIFAQRAHTRKAKLDVARAQLEYRLPRLEGYGKAYSRTGGGIGTRGPGEQQLDIDRRAILQQIHSIKRQQEKALSQHEKVSKKRRASDLPLVALAGYTNAGKSTLLNVLLALSPSAGGREVYADDRLFATLDVSTRRIQGEGEPPYLLADTIGFIHHLPEELKQAFQSSLSEIGAASLLLLVIDSSDASYGEQVRTVVDFIKKEREHFPLLYIMNQADRAQPPLVTDPERTLRISAKNPLDVQGLHHRILSELYGEEEERSLLIPYQELDKLSYLREAGEILQEEEGREKGLAVRARARKACWAAFFRDFPAREEGE